MSCSLKYQLALTLLKGVGVTSLRPLLEHFSPEAIFNTATDELAEKALVSPHCIQAIANFKDWNRVEKEIQFIEAHHINTYFITDTAYPYRLKDCNDAPLLLFTKGKPNLNPPKTLAVVGTRSNSVLGKKFTEEILAGLQSYSEMVIVSGLAAGIDTIAHEEALRNKLTTWAVLAHGLDRIYPSINRRLALAILDQGGCLITECRHGEEPDRYLFPRRNRIVAGISDATLVIESNLKGGSLITANLALSYGRSVLAMPGRVTDVKSSGCLELIKTQKAQLITSAADLLLWLNWAKQEPNKSVGAKKSDRIFTEEEKIVLAFLEDGDEKHMEVLLQLTGWSPTHLAAVLLDLSLADHIVSLPGNKYQLI
ncbi:MAG: DNA-protecting protein DprA [Bacteroidota bacterium]|nr:DNA processing protein DprA [Bacteroidota bacterium]